MTFTDNNNADRGTPICLVLRKHGQYVYIYKCWQESGLNTLWYPTEPVCVFAE